MLAALLLASAASAQADSKIAYVDADKVLQSAPQTAEVGKKLDKEFSPRNAELQKLQKQIEAQEASLSKDSLTLGESERSKRQSDIADYRLELERKQREFTEDLNIRKNEELAALQERVKAAVKTVAESGNYDMVLFSSVAYSSKQTDITDNVLKLLSR